MWSMIPKAHSVPTGRGPCSGSWAVGRGPWVGGLVVRLRPTAVGRAVGRGSWAGGLVVRLRLALT